MTSVPNDPARRSLVLLAGALLALASCSGGQEKPIVTQTITARMIQDPPPVSGAAVFLGNVRATGDSLQMDVLVRGPLDVDDADLVLRFDAAFIQVVSLTSQNALFGTCNTVNAACSLVSPVCADNRPEANGGQGSPGNANYCRSNGSTPCTVATVKTDCPAAGDACGIFGRLEQAQAVVTGPKVCTNRTDKTCSQNADCQFCLSNPSQNCTDSTVCSGQCQAGTCTLPPGRNCLTDNDCADTCSFPGTCQGCPAVALGDGQIQKLATLTLRIMTVGTGDFRFVVSSTAGASGISALRKELVDQPVQFFPSVDSNDVSLKTGSILIEGTK